MTGYAGSAMTAGQNPQQGKRMALQGRQPMLARRCDFVGRDVRMVQRKLGLRNAPSKAK
jgi:hypothetical protein